MNLQEVFYVPRPDDGEEPGNMTFRLADDWAAVDGQKLLLPITITERNDQEIDPPQTGVLSQYGGHQLLNQLLLELDEPPEAGDEFYMQYSETRGFHITPL